MPLLLDQLNLTHSARDTSDMSSASRSDQGLASGCLERLNRREVHARGLAKILLPIEKVMKHNKKLSPKVQATRKNIISAAIECFRERGVQGSSVDLIAERAGVTKPTLYSHFGSKDNLFDAVVDAIKHQTGSSVWPTYNPDLPLLDQLITNFMAHLDTRLALKSRQLFRALLIELTRRGEEQPLNEDRPRVLELSQILDAAQAHGVIQTIDSTATAKVLMSMVKGQFFWPAVLGIEKTSVKKRKKDLETSLRAILTPMLVSSE